MSAALPPTNDPGFDLYADQRGRIIGTMVAIFVITTTAVALRFLSRKLSRAGLWVRLCSCNTFHTRRCSLNADGSLVSSGTITYPLQP